jgi:hypothetical protein
MNSLSVEDYRLIYDALCDYRQYCCMKDQELFDRANRLIDAVRPFAYSQMPEQPT